MNRWQKLGALALAATLLLSFWAGLWYQAQRLAPAAELVGKEALMEVDNEKAGNAEANDEKTNSENDGASDEDAALDEAKAAGEKLADGNYAEGKNSADGANGPLYAVHVVGQVASSGVYYLAPGSRLYDAVMLAQPLDDANLDRLNLALPVEDGMQIRVPKGGINSQWADGQLVVLPQQSVSEEAPGKINLNTATQAQLESLPGIGPAYAKRILEYRKQKGNFKQIEDLKEIKGIGPAIIENLKDLVVCSS